MCKSSPFPDHEAESKPATSKDVAKLAGVSVASVCRVFDKKWIGKVSPRLEEKVLSAAAQLNYHPNALARSLTAQRSGIIGVVMSEAFNEFYFDLFCRITNRLQDYGMRVMVFNSEPYRDLEQVLSHFIEYRVDGIIITASAISNEIHTFPSDIQVPLTLVNVYMEEPFCNSVICDNFAGAREMACYLYGCGGRRFLFLSAENSLYYDVKERLAGFQTGLALCGAAPDCLHVERGDYTYVTGQALARKVLSRPDRPDTVFCVGTRLALGFMDAARHEFGLRIPEDISVAGYDDLVGAEFESYGLTCIEQPSQSMADTAVQLLLAELDGHGAPPKIYREQPQLRIRSSVRRKDQSA